MVDLRRPSADPTTTDPITPAAPARGTRRVLRHVAVAAVSVLVLLGAAVYVLGPGDARVRLTAQEVGVQHYDDTVAAVRVSAARPPLPGSVQRRRPAPHRWTQTIYGSVSASGVSVSRISLRIAGAVPATRAYAATVPIPQVNRAYRSLVHLRPGRYTVTLRLTVSGRVRTVSVGLTLSDRRHYAVRATVRAGGVVSFLPVSTY